MRVSVLFGEALREAPADADIVSHPNWCTSSRPSSGSRPGHAEV
jgi:hypothetical protein